MIRKVVGQIINIVDEDGYSTITVETAAGDIVHLYYDQSATGLEPRMSVICAVHYISDGDTLLVQKIERPKPGEYRATYEKAQPPESIQIGKRVPTRDSSPDSVFVEDISTPEDSIFSSYGTPSTRRTATTPRTVKPRKPSINEARKEGVLLVTVIYLLIGLILVLIPHPLTVILGLLLFFEAIGMYTYESWAYWLSILFCVFLGVTLIGLILAIPFWNFLNKDEIKTLYNVDM
ncbi:MAG: hypothetical protein ACFFDR_04455 [Candidatus Thorarchaeota archaeon]